MKKIAIITGLILAAALSAYSAPGDKTLAVPQPKFTNYSAGVAAKFNTKQNTLVSGTNIKTVNGSTLLGSGDIAISGGGGTWGSITGTLSAQTDLQTALNGKQASGSYAPATSGTSVLLGNGSGGFSAYAGGTCGGNTHVISISSTGAVTCDTTGGIETVQDEGVDLNQRQKVNFIGAGITCVDNTGQARTDCTVPSTKDTTAITGLLKGNGSTVSAATAGTDYLTPSGSAASLTSFPTFNQNTTGSAGSISGTAVITNSNLATMLTKTYKGNTTAGTASPTDVPVATLKTDLALTKSDVGLSAVENTALTTWTGNTAITSLGTVATGTWNATAIADGKIASALTGKTYNGITPTAAANGFTLAGGTVSKTMTFPNTLTISGTDSSTLNIGAGGTLGSNAYTSTAYEPGLGNPGTSGFVLSSTTGGVRSWVANGGASMVYPGAGVAVSTGSAWGTSLNLTAISDSTSTTSSTTAASSTAVKAAYDLANGKEAALGNPASNGYVLSSTTTGTRSWVAQSGGGGTPASTVVSETTYGQATAVGTSANFAREDHTHGTVASEKDTTTVTGLLKGNGTAISAAVSGTDYVIPSGSVATLTTPRTIAGTSFNGSANITLANKFIVQGTSDAGLSGPQFLGALGTGIVKNTTTTGVLSIAANSDLPAMSATVGGAVPTPPNSASQFLNGQGGWSVPASSGIGAIYRTTADYTNATTTPSNITGLSWSAAASTDYAFTCTIHYMNTATSALRLNINGPASPTRVTFKARYQTTSATSEVIYTGNAFSAAAQTSAVTTGNAATAGVMIVTGIIQNGANAGTINLMGTASTAAQTNTVYKGSYCEVY